MVVVGEGAPATGAIAVEVAPTDGGGGVGVDPVTVTGGEGELLCIADGGCCCDGVGIGLETGIAPTGCGLTDPAGPTADTAFIPPGDGCDTAVFKSVEADGNETAVVGVASAAVGPCGCETDVGGVGILVVTVTAGATADEVEAGATSDIA